MNYAVRYHSEIPVAEQTAGLPNGFPSKVQPIGDGVTDLPPALTGWHVLTKAELDALRATHAAEANAVKALSVYRNQAAARIRAELERRLTIAAGREYVSEKLIAITAEGCRLIWKKANGGTLTGAESTRMTAIGTIFATLQTLVEKADALQAAVNAGQTPVITDNANW
jgi:hypothetical protein